jgi:putative endonuclease
LEYFVYILQSSKDNKYYVGMTNDVNRRLKEHNAGLQKSTKARRPFKLVYKECCASRKEARIKEKQLKSGYLREARKYINDRGVEQPGSSSGS